MFSTFYQTILYQFLADKILLVRPAYGDDFMRWVLGPAILTWIFSIVFITCHKVWNDLKRWKARNAIHILPNPNPSFNNHSYNVTLVSAEDLCQLLALLVSVIVIANAPKNQDIFEWYKQRIFNELFHYQLAYKVIHPIFYLIRRKDVRKFMLRYVQQEINV